MHFYHTHASHALKSVSSNQKRHPPISLLPSSIFPRLLLFPLPFSSQNPNPSRKNLESQGPSAMVLGQLGGSISRALQQMCNATIIDEKVLSDCLNEISRALLQADVQFRMVRDMQANIKSIVNLDDLAAGHNKRRIIQKAVFDELCKMLDPGKPSFMPKKGKTSVIMFVGLQGNMTEEKDEEKKLQEVMSHWQNLLRETSEPWTKVQKTNGKKGTTVTNEGETSKQQENSYYN